MNLLLNDLELYSDLVTSIGSGISDRPLTPIECSDLIIRLKEETNESRQQLSKRLGLGKKRKIKTLDEQLDTTQILLFERLQKLSRQNAYMLGFGMDDGKIPFTIGCFVAELPNKKDHNIILKTILSSYDSEKKINKSDVFEIVSRKKKSPNIPIETIIEDVMKVKPVIDEYYLIGVTVTTEFIEKINSINTNSKQILKIILTKIIKGFEISSISLKTNTVFISMNKTNFEILEKQRKQQKLSITKFFVKLFDKGVENELSKIY